jgi:hypothetical protein
MCSWNFVTIIIALNLSLSALHWFLTWLSERTQNKCDDRAAKIVGYLLTLLEWAMAARRRP